MLKKLKSLFKNSIIYSLRGVTAQLIGVLLVPIYTRVFSTEQNGVIDLITTSTILLNLFFLLGLDSAVGRYYVDGLTQNDRKLTVSTAFFFHLFSLAIIIPFVIFFSREISFYFLGSKDYAAFLVVTFLAVPFSIVSSFCENLLKWTMRPIAYSIVSIGALVLQCVLTIYLVVFARIGLIGIFIAFLVTQMIFAGVGILLVRGWFSFTFCWQRLKGLLSFGAPLVFLALAHYIMTYSDRYFLRIFQGLEVVGLYGVAYKMSFAVSFVIAGFQNAWGPFLYSMYKDEKAARVIAKIYSYVATFICFVVLVISLFAKEILMLFTTQAYYEAYLVVPFIAASVAAYTLGGYFSVGIGISKKTFQRAWIGIAAFILNLVLNYFFIPLWSMIGAAVATIISFLFLGCVSMVISQRYYPVPYRFKSVFVMFFFAAVVISIVYKFFQAEVNFINFCFKLIAISLFVLIPFLLKLVSLDDLLKFKQPRLKT